MPEELEEYLGIPRKLIPWFPEIDEAVCNGCKACVAFCKHGVYAADEAKEKSRVANPYHCVVYCQGCQFQCPQEAISFPRVSQVKEVVKDLRKTYPPR